jgi:hypothetical protein
VETVRGRVLSWFKENWDFATILVCFTLFASLTVWYVNYETNHAQHVFCGLLTTLTSVKPPGGDLATNPSRAYNVKISENLVTLKEGIGC